MSEYIEVPRDQLGKDILQALIEDYITREGTDYGLKEFSLQQKVAQIEAQLASGGASIVFDPVTETCTIIGKDR